MGPWKWKFTLYRIRLQTLSKPPDIPQLSRILLDLLDPEMNLDMDYSHNIRNKTGKILYPECIGIIFLMFSKDCYSEFNWIFVDVYL